MQGSIEAAPTTPARGAGRALWRRLAVAGAIAALATASACQLDLEPPATATIRCGSDGDCPPGWSCRPAIGLCSRTHDSGLPPAVVAGSASVSPATAAAGASLVVRFEVSAPLHADPVVELDTTPRTALRVQSVDGQRYAYTLAVGPTVPEGVFSVVVGLLGKDGALARDLKIGDVTVDRTPPVISRIDTLTRAVKAGDRVVLEVTFGEALAAPSARVLGGPTLTAVATDRPQVWRLESAASGTELEGPASVEVQAADAAGNGVTRTITDAFTYDFTAPALTPDAEVLTSVVRGGQLAAVHLQLSEALRAAPVVQLVGTASATTLPLAVVEQVGTAWTFGRLVEVADPQETFEVQVSGLVDLAGNAGVAAGAGTLRIDSTPPRTVSGPILVETASGQYRAGDRVVFTVAFDEPLARAPRAHLAATSSIPFDCLETTPGLAFRCTLGAALTGLERPESTVKVVVEYEDGAGNAGLASTSATLDFTGPSIVPASPALALTPPAGALVAAAAAATGGTRLRVSFSVTEPLGADPEVATTLPSALAFTRVSASGTHYEFEAIVPPGDHTPGSHAVQVRLTDVAGNETRSGLDLPGAGLRIDTSAPPSPDVATVGRIVYARDPWGSGGAGGIPRFTVTGLSGAVEPGAAVIAYDGPDPAHAREIGRTSAASDGSFPAMALVTADRTRVWVLQVDEAGNASDADPATGGPQAALVRDVTWTASMTGKVVGSLAENPNAFEVRPRFLGAVAQGGSREATLPVETRGTLAWVRSGGSAAPGAFENAVFDARRGRVVVLNDADLPGVWEWGGRTWTKVLPAGISADGAPTGIAGATYDERRGEVVIFDTACTPQLWAWDGRVWTIRGTGLTSGNGTSGQWPAPGPHGSGTAALGYDRLRGEIVLTSRHPTGAPLYPCGGVEDGGTYAWTGTGWRAFAGRFEGPFDLFFEPTQNALVGVGLFFGFRRWDGAAWVSVAGGSSGRVGFDPASRRPLRADGAATSAWSWSTSSWTAIGPGVAGGVSSLVSDTAAGRLLALNAGGAWAWTGNAWTAIGPVLPSAATVGLAYDPVVGAVEAFAADGGIHRWSSAGWGAVDPQGAVTPAGLNAAAQDPAGLGVIAHAPGGSTWRWDGTGWTRLLATDGITTPTVTLVNDPGRGLLLLGPEPAFVWSGPTVSWTAGSSLSRGQPGAPSRPVFSPAVGAPVAWISYAYKGSISDWVAVYGGYPANLGQGLRLHHPLAPDGAGRTFLLTPARTLETLAANLTRTPVAVDLLDGPPPATAVQASIWNPVEEVIDVAFPGELWRLESEQASRPGHVFRAAYGTSGGPSASGCLLSPASCPIQSVTVTWRGIATPRENVSPTSASIAVWDGSQFAPVGVVPANAGAPASATFQLGDPSVIGRLGAGTSGELVIAVRALGDAFPAPLLRTDDVAVTVAYRLP